MLAAMSVWKGVRPRGSLGDQKRSRGRDEGRTVMKTVMKGDKTLTRHVDGRGLVSDSSRTTVLRVEVKTHTPKNNEKKMRAAR